MESSSKPTRPIYPPWLTNLLGAILFFLLGVTVYSLAAERQRPQELEQLRQEIAAVKDSVLLLAYSSDLSDTVRERILEDTGLLRGQGYVDIWRERDRRLARFGRRDTVQIGVVLLDALLKYYQQWGDLRGVITLRNDSQDIAPLRVAFNSLDEAKELVDFIGRYRGTLSLRKVEFLPLEAVFDEDATHRPESLRSLSLFLINAYVEKAPVLIEVALSPSFVPDAE
jgi:hypothetical protein